MIYLTYFLVVYIISIFWCKWAVKKITPKDHQYHNIFSNDYLIGKLSWVPLVNSFFAVACSYVMFMIYVDEVIKKRRIKNKLNKMAKKYKKKDIGTYEAIKEIANKI